MQDGKTEVEVILNSSLPFAEEMLSRYGEFYPCGRAMKSDGDLVAVEVFDDQERLPSDEIINRIVQVFRQQAAKGENRATAIIYDVKIIPPGQTSKTDAVAAELEHRDGYAVTVFYPYHLGEGGPELGPPFATAARRGIFDELW